MILAEIREHRQKFGRYTEVKTTYFHSHCITTAHMIHFFNISANLDFIS